MPVPTYDRFIEPVLRFLAAHPDGATARDAHDAAAQALGLSDADRAELLPSGTQQVFKNRAGWAHDRLKRAGLSTSSRRGYWQLTKAGLDFARNHAAPLPENVLETIAVWHNDVRLRPGGEERQEPSPLAPPLADRGTVSPDDRLEQALSELRQGVAAELLELLSQVSPEYFETIVLDLLHRMGYGTSRRISEIWSAARGWPRTGRPGSRGGPSPVTRAFRPEHELGLFAARTRHGHFASR